MPNSHRLDHWAGPRRDGRGPDGEALATSPPWPESYGVRTVPARAGDCILFSEKLWRKVAQAFSIRALTNGPNPAVPRYGNRYDRAVEGSHRASHAVL